MLVLKGNIPRFPSEPSTTMLTYGLNGTTEASASSRNRPTTLTDQHHQRPGQLHRDAPRIFARPGEHPRCSTLLTCYYMVAGAGFEPATFGL
jgi:hypothetical protein